MVGWLPTKKLTMNYDSKTKPVIPYYMRIVHTASTRKYFHGHRHLHETRCRRHENSECGNLKPTSTTTLPAEQENNETG
ncbi:hypothetical protein SCLCIDRAFT_969891 [Scleroderma citrinum Foug A]|uniref:Uncharacterized protein n=1 Tax=Scleroderma citrinum Foug A TaxID=1036808 RepID=A0A0C3A5W8_9AGAM|nr:hypothetical protein SCLCIDRAFT_969891 [Scleroderma citrinum Foug A]